MFKHILIPTDGSDLSRKAVLYGVRLAKESGAKVTALTVAEPYPVAAMDESWSRSPRTNTTSNRAA